MKIWIMMLCTIAISVSFGNAKKSKKSNSDKLLRNIDDDIKRVEETMDQHFQELSSEFSELEDRNNNLNQSIQQILGKINELSNFVTNSSKPEPPQCCNSEFSELEDRNNNLNQSIQQILGKISELSNLVTNSSKPEPPQCCNSGNNEPRYRNCYEILNHSNEPKKSGVYIIYPFASNTAREVYCDMDTDGGGWTVFQRRGPSSSHIGFDKNWASYAEGFGDVEKEFWLGLTTISALTKQGDAELRIDLENFNFTTGYAYYGRFEVDDESKNFTLHVGQYEGTVGNSLTPHNGMQFSTLDKDNDDTSRDCAAYCSGGWWYNYCAHSHLNGPYNPGNGNTCQRIYWHPSSTDKTREPLKNTEMKLRPSTSCP